MDKRFLILVVGNGLIVVHNTYEDQITKNDNLGKVALSDLLLYSNTDEIELTDPVADFSLLVPYGSIVRIEDPEGNEITGLSTIVLLRAFIERVRAVNRMPKGKIDFNLLNSVTRSYSGGNLNNEDLPGLGYMGFRANVTADTNLHGMKKPTCTEMATVCILQDGSGGFLIDVKDESGNPDPGNAFKLPKGFGDDLDDHTIGIFQYDYTLEYWKILNNY